MSFLDQITVLILTYNEENNISRTLEALRSFGRVVVLDSFSSDSTASLVSEFPNATLFYRRFDEHAAQWNFGLEECGISTEWVLALDADYIVSRALVDEVAALCPSRSVSGYISSFNYCIFGHRLSSALYPAHVVLFRRSRGRYEQYGHTQRLLLDGEVSGLVGRIDHDDRKGLDRWFASQARYAALEAEFLRSRPIGEKGFIDLIRSTAILAPPLVFIYALIWRRCILSGWAGWFYVFQRTLAEIMIALELIARSRYRGEARQKAPTVPGEP